MIRASGITSPDADSISAQAHDVAVRASLDPAGQWILSPHHDGATEAGWAGVVSSALHLIRVDRLFRAGVAPFEAGEKALWIIDYKTAHVETSTPAAIAAAFRETFEPQLEMYASILRNWHGEELEIRAGLYYPRMQFFDWWKA